MRLTPTATKDQAPFNRSLTYCSLGVMMLEEIGTGPDGKPRLWDRREVSGCTMPPSSPSDIEYIEWSRMGTARSGSGGNIKTEMKFKEAAEIRASPETELGGELPEKAWQAVRERVVIFDPDNYHNSVTVRFLQIGDSDAVGINYDGVPTQTIDIADLKVAYGSLMAIPIEPLWERIEEPPYYLPMKLFELPPPKPPTRRQIRDAARRDLLRPESSAAKRDPQNSKR